MSRVYEVFRRLAGTADLPGDRHDAPPRAPTPLYGAGSQSAAPTSSPLPAAVLNAESKKRVDFQQIADYAASAGLAPAPAGAAPDLTGPNAESANFLDFRQISDYAGFMARALRRRKFTAAGTFVLVLAATAAALLVLPRIYHAEVTLLAQRNQVMAA